MTPSPSTGQPASIPPDPARASVKGDARAAPAADNFASLVVQLQTVAACGGDAKPPGALSAADTAMPGADKAGGGKAGGARKAAKSAKDAAASITAAPDTKLALASLASPLLASPLLASPPLTPPPLACAASAQGAPDGGAYGSAAEPLAVGAIAAARTHATLTAWSGHDALAVAKATDAQAALGQPALAQPTLAQPGDFSPPANAAGQNSTPPLVGLRAEMPAKTEMAALSPTTGSVSGAAAQIARAVVAIAPVAADGTTKLTIALHPDALGPVAIHIARAADGSAAVAVAAANPRTLDMLRHDRAALDQALTAAGVPDTGRSVSFAVQPAAHIAAETGLGAAPQGQGSGMQGFGAGAGNFGTDARNGPGGQSGGQGGGQGGGHSGGTPLAEPATRRMPAPPGGTTGTRQSGIDVYA